MEENFEVILYQTENGKIPIKEFKEKLDLSMKTKLMMETNLLKEYRNNPTMPYSRPLEKGIFELRIQAANNISRVMYFFMSGRKIILHMVLLKRHRKHHQKK